MLWAPETIDLSALAEICRCTASTASSASIGRTLIGRIAAVYAGGESSAAVVIGEVESAVDLHP